MIDRNSAIQAIIGYDMDMVKSMSLSDVDEFIEGLLEEKYSLLSDDELKEISEAIKAE